ncbi:Helicase domino [Thelohanellus kitauei]|uniref:Helicase domino n=1 Tax=Thelohanellus kitauei TaxID=669202 RepID=A0A0C2N8L0_THEKT|nr:Helicase domino [Thelohanellus kitauei]
MKYKTQFIETSEAHDHITEKLTESRKRKMSPDTLHPIELFPGLPSEAAQYLAYGRDLASKLFPRNILVPNGHLFPLTLLKRTLWPYQMVGVEWLVNLFDSDVNGILIQGTELGDTVQIIAYLVSLAEHKHVWGPHLIVVPKVDMLRWYNDFQEWCPGLKVHLYYKPEVSLNRCTTDDSSGFHQVVITSYEFMGCRSQHLTNQKWCCLILGTGIIPDPRLNQILTKVVSERRVLITDSRPELMVSQFDLKDLLNFLLPHNLQSYDISGLKSSNVEMDKISSNKYIELLEPFILYRNLDDIKDQIPRMEEIFVECPMKLQQVNLYHNYLSETYMSLFGSKGPTNLQFINILIDLCCHPELCTPHLPKTPYVSPPLIQHVPLSLTFETFDFFKPLLFLPSEFDPAASALTSAKIFGGSDQLSFGLKVKDCLGKNTRYENTSTPQVVKNPNYCSCTYLCRCSLSIKNTLSGKILLNTPQMKQYYKTRLEYNVIRTLENSPPPLYGERTRNFFKLDDDWSWMRGFDMYNKLLDLVDYDYFRKFRCVLPSKTQTWPFVLHPSRLGLYLRTNCPIISPDWGHIFDKSGKLQRLDQLLAHITTKRSKIVIISQSLEILDMLEKYMCYRNLRYVRVDHTSAFEDHIILGDMFDKNISVNFLITTTITDAFDLNLSKADRFVLFDVEWRPNLRARLENYLKHACHNRKIYVYKLFAVGTIEEFLKETDLFGLINDKNLDAAKSAVEKITDLTLKKLLLAITEQKDLNFNQSDVFDSISRKAGRGKISDISQSILANCDLVSPIELFAMRQINMADLMVLRKKMTDHENIPLDSVDSLLTKWKKDRQIVEELQDLHLHSLPSDKIKKFDGFHAKELTKKVYK